MSHEIRTPLNGVLGLAQIGARNSRGRVAKETFGRILHSGKLLLAIVNDILDFSKIEAGKLRVENMPVLLDRVLDEAIEPVRERARTKSLALHIDKAADLPAACLGDPLRLTQILMNLVANAVKFTDHGHVTLGATREGDVLVFRVADTGIGMSADQIDQVFVPFHQADSSAVRKFSGTGLGLSISRRLAQLLGGEIRVSSTPGQGSVFELRLPYLAAPPPAAILDAGAGLAAPRGARLAGLAILVAEDNQTNQIVLTEFLAGEGAQVVMVANGRQAVDQVAAGGPKAFDIVLMDIQMRDMDGHEATRRILELVPDLPVLGQTAHVMAEERARGLAVGMLDYVAKPLDIEDLVAKVRRYARRQPSATRLGPAAAPAPRPPLAGPPREGAAATVDWAELETQYADRPEFVARLVASVLQTDGETPAKLRSAAAAGNLDEMTFLAHNTYNMALVTRAYGLQRLAKKAEVAAKTELPEAASAVRELAAATELLLEQLAQRGAAPAPCPSSLPEVT